MNTADAAASHISAIKIFKLIEDEIKGINTYPLSPDNLVIQQDAYRRLAASEDEDYDFEVFAHLEHARKEKDTDLRFLVQFAAEVFVLSIEGLGDIVMEYTGLADTNETVAEQIVATLRMLANGQLWCLHTNRNGRLCAVELVYCDNPGAPPETISIESNYPKFLKNDDPDTYGTHAFKNHFPIQHITKPKKFFLQASKDDGTPVALNRTFENNTITPLTKTHYQEIINKVGNMLAGAKDNAEFEQKTQSSWLLWALLAIFATPVILWVPDSIFSYVGPIAGLIAYFVASLITARYLFYAEQLRQTQPQHPLLKIDNAINKQGLLAIAYSLSLAATSVSVAFPIYATKEGHHIVTLYQLSQITSLLVLLPIAGQLLAIIFIFGKSAIAKAASALSALATIVGLCIVNFALTYTGDEPLTPEPQTTITILAYMAQFVISIAVLISQLKKQSEHNQQD